MIPIEYYLLLMSWWPRHILRLTLFFVQYLTYTRVNIIQCTKCVRNQCIYHYTPPDKTMTNIFVLITSWWHMAYTSVLFINYISEFGINGINNELYLVISFWQFYSFTILYFKYTRVPITYYPVFSGSVLECVY